MYLQTNHSPLYRSSYCLLFQFKQISPKTTRQGLCVIAFLGWQLCQRMQCSCVLALPGGGGAHLSTWFWNHSSPDLVRCHRAQKRQGRSTRTLLEWVSLSAEQKAQQRARSRGCILCMSLRAPSYLTGADPCLENMAKRRRAVHCCQPSLLELELLVFLISPAPSGVLGQHQQRLLLSHRWWKKHSKSASEGW